MSLLWGICCGSITCILDSLTPSIFEKKMLQAQEKQHRFNNHRIEHKNHKITLMKHHWKLLIYRIHHFWGFVCHNTWAWTVHFDRDPISSAAPSRSTRDRSWAPSKMDIIHSGQTIVFHQPKFSWNKMTSPPQLPFGGRGRVSSRANLTRVHVRPNAKDVA